MKSYQIFLVMKSALSEKMEPYGVFFCWIFYYAAVAVILAAWAAFSLVVLLSKEFKPAIDFLVAEKGGSR